MDILQIWKCLIQERADKNKRFLFDNRALAKQYENSFKQRSEIGFNVFTLSSDFYYRENFHSDIIKSLLDPNEKHNEKTRFLSILISLLNQSNPRRYLNKYDFENANVIREKHNIDILITDKVSNKAILIENKIYNAVDQKRQIPRYYDLIAKDYEVEAIIYLTLGSSKYLNKSDWTEEDCARIDPLLYFIPSYGGNSVNLFDNWIVPSIIEAKHAESLFLFRQYGDLIKFINTNSMDTIALEKFYTTLKENDNLQTSISVKNMLNDLPEYLAIRIEERYKANCYPFKNVWRYQRRDTVFEAFELENLYLKMDIWCSEAGYKVHFWNSKNEEYDIKANLSSILSLKDFNYEGGNKHNVERYFAFDEEEVLYEFIDNLLSELKEFKINTISTLPNVSI